MAQIIYFDNAATTYRKPRIVLDAVYKAMETMGNASRGVYEAALISERLIYDTREKVNDFFGGDSPERVAFTSNATESLNIAISGLFTEEDHVITTELEHNSVLRPLYRMEERGMELTVLKSDGSGNISYEEMEAAVKQNTKAVVCTHASNLTGNCLDIDKIGKLCEKYGILFVLDVSQTAGLLPIDMKKSKISVLCFTGHKGLYGPQGTGGICVREGIEIKPFKVGGSGIFSYQKFQPAQMPTVLEAGTLNGHGIAGLNAALQYLSEKGVENIYAQGMKCMERCLKELSGICGVTVYGDFTESKRIPIVSFNLDDCDSGMISDELAHYYGIASRAGAHCAPLMHRALGTEQKGAVRFSFSHFNTEEEVITAVEAIKELYGK
jgi:cysteine desulfurase family protein